MWQVVSEVEQKVMRHLRQHRLIEVWSRLIITEVLLIQLVKFPLVGITQFLKTTSIGHRRLRMQNRVLHQL